MGDTGGAARVRFLEKGQRSGIPDVGGYEDAMSEAGQPPSVVSGISHALSASFTATMSRAGSASLSEFSTLARKREEDDRPPATIHEAAERGLAKEIVRMVERTLDFEVDKPDRYGRTALMWAAEQSHVETAATLLDLGADRRATDQQTCRSALHLAARAAMPDMLRVLLEDLSVEEREGYVNQPDRNGITPVFLAKQKEQANRSNCLRCFPACGPPMGETKKPIPRTRKSQAFFKSKRVAVTRQGWDAGEEGLEAFEYLLACGARYNQQAWKELGALPPAPIDHGLSPGDRLTHAHSGKW